MESLSTTIYDDPWYQLLKKYWINAKYETLINSYRLKADTLMKILCISNNHDHSNNNNNNGVYDGDSSDIEIDKNVTLFDLFETQRKNVFFVKTTGNENRMFYEWV